MFILHKAVLILRIWDLRYSCVTKHERVLWHLSLSSYNSNIIKQINKKQGGVRSFHSHYIIINMSLENIRITFHT